MKKTATARKKKRVRHLLVDGDYLVYRWSFAVEKETNWGDDLWTLHADADEAIAGLEGELEDYRLTLKADKVTLCMSCPGADNFRLGIYADYKANRADKRKPLCYQALRQYALGVGVSFANLEADDVMGILATERTKEDRIIVSLDKDMRTIPGKLFLIRPKGEPEKLIIDEDSADLWFYKQALMGDATDNIPGLPGVGPVKADKLLDGVAPEDRWKAVVAAYEAKGMTAKDALMNARLVRILRAGDYNKTTGEVKLWEPK